MIEILFSQRLKKFLKETFLLGLFMAVIVFAWVRLLFFEVPFSLSEDSMTLIKTILTSWLIMGVFRIFWYLLLRMIGALRPALIRSSGAVRWMILILLSVSLYACQTGGFRKGFSIDGTTGLSVKYDGISTKESRLVMNGETLNHTDIPLGENFTLINDGIDGLTIKDRQVSVGCSLVITDTAGRAIFSEPDLFADHGLFNKDSVQYLQCRVNTGAPMLPDEHYGVKVTFWDKYGTGKIENSVRVRIIDEP
ncbi:hypothetical protein LZZ85_02425 [Terrimonas sp. NA20]|uniref:Uncharacterized protein n=1 Tax=Terrimonas ginsenosidimutans TaxID=2908004 RepID=A0ABS9KLG4_9BACT|nr:hypothetical protein [Terrimonas ginsenosidimutans]MCG2613110.1 hypothetical protein [Terrimonas ginsenosidimutans]